MKRALIIGVLLLGASHPPAVGSCGTVVSNSLAAPRLPAVGRCGPVAPAAESRLQDCEFQSDSLARSMRYRIFLPTGYSESTGNYPVLYLLHGWHGDHTNWSTLTKLTDYAKDLPIIIVMPDAGDSWYVDSATVAQDKYERYIVHDLIDEIDQHWRTLRSAQRRAIAGLSMGGYAAVKFTLKYPETFGLAASVSGAFNAALPELAEARADLRPSLLQAFGPATPKTRALRAQNDVYELAAHADPRPVPYLYIDCGNQDVTFLDPNRKFVSILSQKHFQYEYHEYPGAHTWQYWDERLPALLNIVERFVAPERGPTR